VDAAFLVAFRVNPHRGKFAAPLTGAFEGDDADELTRQIVNAFENTVGVGRRYEWQDHVYYLPNGNYTRRLPEVPELEMAVQVNTTSAPLRLTVKGTQPQGDWAGLWAKFYSSTSQKTYDRAQGTNISFTTRLGKTAVRQWLILQLRAS
jgi:hypothetical protein